MSRSISKSDLSQNNWKKSDLSKETCIYDVHTTVEWRGLEFIPCLQIIFFQTIELVFITVDNVGGGRGSKNSSVFENHKCVTPNLGD